MISFSNFMQKSAAFAAPYLCLEQKKSYNPESHSFYNETYDEIVANLDPTQLNELEGKMQGTPDPTIYNQIIEAIQSGNLTDELFDIEDFELYALLALRNNLIDGSSFTTSQLFFNGYRHNRQIAQRRFIPLFMNNTVNLEAWHILLDSAKSDNLDGREGGRSEAELADFFRLMGHATAINQQFMLVSERDLKSKTMGQIVIREHHFKLLSSYRHLNGTLFRILPSKAMFQACLSCRGGNDTPQLVTRFGLSPAEQLKVEILDKKRDFCLNFKALPQVLTADQITCDPTYNEVELHDFLHGELVTSTPYEVRFKLYGLAELCHNLAAKIANEDQKKFFEQLEERFIDMEHYDYLKSDDFSEEVKFWSLLWIYIKDTLIRSNPIISMLEADEIFKGFFLQETGDLFLQALIDQADQLKKNYQLDLQDLIELRKLSVDEETPETHHMVKKLALLLRQKITSRLAKKSLFKVAFGFDFATQTLVKTEAWRLIRKQNSLSFFYNYNRKLRQQN